MQTKLDRKPHAEAVISGTLAAADIEKHFKKALDRFVREVDLPGFRKGKAPAERIVEEVGKKSIWREAAEEALKDSLVEVMAEHKVLPIVPPSISLTVGEADTDVPFTVTIITAPTVELKDFKKVGTDALAKLDKLDEEKEKGEARKSLDAQTRSMLQITEERELTDDEAKQLGFENVAAMHLFLGEEAVHAVERYDEQRKRGAVADALTAAAKVEVPLVIIDDEARNMLESTKQNIARQGMPFNEYLDKRGLAEADIMTELKPQAEKRVILDLIFAHIAKEESLKPDDEETHRVAHALMHQGVPDQSAHQYGAEVSLREQVWALYGLAKPKPEPLKEVEAHDHSDPNHTH